MCVIKRTGRLHALLGLSTSRFKRTTTPALTRSMHMAAGDLGLHRLSVVHAGARAFDLAANIRAVPIGRILDDVAPLR